MKKTTIILGAGSSCDYGYPLWDKLRAQMISLKAEEFLKNIDGLNQVEIDDHILAHSAFLKWAEENPGFTLDKIIYEIDKPKEKHINPTGHYLINLAGHLLSQVEMKLIDGGWVTKFQNILIDYIARTHANLNPQGSENVLKNLKVISLNYDRVFEHFVSKDFFNKLVQHPEYNPQDLSYSIKLANNNSLSILKPHGFVCGLANENIVDKVGMKPDLAVGGTRMKGIRYPGSTSTLRYGDRKLLTGPYFLRMGRYMHVVDEQGDDEYRVANNAIRASEVVFCLGLSDKGIAQSNLEFGGDKSVYLSNKESDIPVISEAKSDTQFVSLGQNGSRLDANNFPDVFLDIVLG